MPRSVRSLDWYHCIVHLVTAADGAEDAFAKEVHARGMGGMCASLPPLTGDASRSSSAAAKQHLAAAREQALRIDSAIRDVQSSHPHYVRVCNEGGFEAKLRRAVEAVVERVQAAEDQLVFEWLRDQKSCR